MKLIACSAVVTPGFSQFLDVDRGDRQRGFHSLRRISEPVISTRSSCCPDTGVHRRCLPECGWRKADEAGAKGGADRET